MNWVDIGRSESLRVDLSQFESIWVDLGWVDHSLPASEPLPGAILYFFESESSWISAEIGAKEFFSTPEIENVIFFMADYWVNSNAVLFKN